MSPRFLPKPPRTFTSSDLSDAFTDFTLSRQAMQCTPATMEFYAQTARRFLLWAETQGITSPRQIVARTVRQYLADLAEQGKKDTTLHDHARGIKTLVRFFHKEGYCTRLIEFEMPRLEKKRLPILTADDLRAVCRICCTRDKAIVLFMADTGIRRAEVCALNWGDVNMENGLIRITQGKGKKDRSAVCGATTRRALLKYRRSIKWTDETPLFLSRTRERFTGDGLEIMFRRLRKQTGIHITPHALRRTFVILSLRRHMDAGHIQAMLGHASLDMVYYYAQIEDQDLIRAHSESSPIDDLF